MFVSRPVPSTGAQSPAMRLVLSVLPIVLMGGIFFAISQNGEDRDGSFAPVVIAFGLMVLANAAGVLVRKFSLSGRISVNQMQGTVTFVPVGGRRTTLQTGDLTSIDLSPFRKQDGTAVTSRGRGWTVLGLTAAPGGQRYRLTMVQGDPAPLRQLADELSVLTSVTVQEEA